MKNLALLIPLLIFTFSSCRNSSQNLPNVVSGSVERISDFKSKYVSSRNVEVWLPNNYSDTAKCNVVYMHDGQMLFDSSKTWNKQEWRVDETVAKLTSKESISPTIIVGIWNDEKTRHLDYFPEKPFESLLKTQQDSILAFAKRGKEKLFESELKSNDYLKFIVQELKPLIDKTYSTNPAMEGTFMAGSSMGGLISMYALCEYPEVFSKAACLSTHWIGTFTTENNPIPNAFVSYLKENLPDGTTHKIYFDYGTETLDAEYEPFQIAVDNVLKESNWPESSWKSLKFTGADHSEKSWSERLQFPMTFLLEENPVMPVSPTLSLKEANRLASLPYKCMQNEYPNKLGQVLGGIEDLDSPKELHPAFYGCFDWHSAVHGHWSVVRLLKSFPNLEMKDSLRKMLKENISKEHILKEVDYFKSTHNKSYERTYGWAWLLKLAEEIHSWKDPLAKELEQNLNPLTELIEERFIEFLPKLVYPIRVGEHTNTAFGLTFAWDYANALENSAFKDSIEQRALDFYKRDKYGPMSYEPSGYDFLSPTLEEVDLMRRVLPERDFHLWLDEFLPQLTLSNFYLEPGEILDRTDGKLVHLDGLNFSRAWVLYGLANQYNEYAYLKLIADEHMNYSLPNLVGDSYEGGHWLGSFAIYALGENI